MFSSEASLSRLAANRERIASLPLSPPPPRAGWGEGCTSAIHDLRDAAPTPPTRPSPAADARLRQLRFPRSLADDFRHAPRPREQRDPPAVAPPSLARTPDARDGAAINDGFPKEALQTLWRRARGRRGEADPQEGEGAATPRASRSSTPPLPSRPNPCHSGGEPAIAKSHIFRRPRTRSVSAAASRQLTLA
ncbi:hypothetical protein AB1Y20_011311 [Prymnesium parvum]|uniref:Uncharacterized protein n=1 Tax=Prymnesium parvum TaxID=97485 RepID=A0AB34IMG9_PRYPA